MIDQPTFSVLECGTLDAAHEANAVALDVLRDLTGAHGNRWSDVFTKDGSYGILWDSPISGVFWPTVTEDMIVDGEGWEAYVAPVEEVTEGL